MNRLILCAIIVAGIGFIATQSLPAADYQWNTTNGFVDVAANWNPNTGIPSLATDNAFINGGVAKIDSAHLFGGSINSLVAGSSSSGTVLQSGGTVNLGSVLSLGQAAGTYGYYQLSDGTINVTNGWQPAPSTAPAVRVYATIGDNDGFGVFSQTGGQVNISAALAGSVNFSIVGYRGTQDTATGVMNIMGGSYNMNTTGSTVNGILVGWGENGVLNIGGTGVVDLASGGGSGLVFLGGGDNAPTIEPTGILNLGGSGILKASSIYYNLGDVKPTSLVNFNGGTWQITSTSTLYGTPLKVHHAYVYSGGATIDTNNKNITLSQALETPLTGTGQGVSEVTLMDSGTGYVGEPVVTITPASGDSGYGATARAILNGSGGIDHIEITNPGVGYTTTPTVTISGGGGTASVSTISLADNVSGGLTKTGLGVLTLNADSTYTGVTTIQQGTLYINKNGLASSGVVVNDTATLAGESLPGLIPGYILPATTVETGGKIAPGAVGRTLYIDMLNFADGATLDFQTASGGASDKIEIMGGGVLPSGTTGDVIVTVDYHGTVDSPTQLLFSSGDLSTHVLFQLPAGLPKLDSQDGRNTPVSLVTSTGIGGSVTLVPGGAIADPKWNVTTGNYNTPGSWDPNTVPNGGGQRAMFVNPLGAGTINVSLNTSPQLSSMVFDSPLGESYKITPTDTNSITLDSTIAQNWHISVLAGTHEVGAKLLLQAGSGESAIRLADNSKLTLSGVLDNETTAAANVNVEGKFNAGTLGNGILVLSGANTYTGKTTVTNAVLQVNSLDVVANANPLGKSSVDPANLVLTDSTLHYAGTIPASTDRGLTLAGANVNLQMDGNVSISGNVVEATDATPTVHKTGAGTLTFNDSTARTNSLGQIIYIDAGAAAVAGGVDTVYKTGIAVIGSSATPVGTVAKINQSSGTLDISGAGNALFIGNVNSGECNVSGGKLDLSNSRLYMGWSGSTSEPGTNSGVLNVSGTGSVLSKGITVGYLSDSAVNQTGGTVTFQGGGGLSGDYGQVIGLSAPGSSYYGISSGTLEFSKTATSTTYTGANDVYIGINTRAFFNQTGGNVVASNSTRFWTGSTLDLAQTAARTINLMGGTFTSNSDHWSSGFLMYYGAGTLNIGGGAVVDLQGSGTVPGFIAAGGQKQVVNIGPSTVKAGLIKGWYATDSVLNLHGGTIIARESTDGEIDNTTFMAGFQHAYLYSEGVTFTVENGHSALIKQVIEDPTGYGVTGDAITIANGGSGYISPPLVTIAGGSAGTGATGYATINSAGVVTGIVITNPGTGYALNDATPITVTFEGGHGTGAEATIDASQLAALTGGTLTKDGPGELTLSGADTYSGDTVVNNGTLNVSLGINTPNALVYVADGGTLNAPSIVADTLSIGGAAMNSAVAVAVPEPGTMVLLTLALVALSVWTRKKIGR